MAKFHHYDSAALLGFTRLVEIQDEQIWLNLLTPQVRALLGRIVRYGEPQVMETIKGHFPGDEASNLNGHRILDARGHPLVRFPYVSTLHKTEHGVIVIKRDMVKVRVTCWVGDVLSGRGQLIFMVGLRDRRYDGTKRANDTALLAYSYDDPHFHRRITTAANSVEVSIYSFVPGSSIVEATGEPEFQQFIEKPFAFLDRPTLFLQYFQRAWHTARAPGQFAAPIKDVSMTVLQSVERIVAGKGYDFVECAVSHYHVALWFKSRGYRYSYAKDATTMAAFGAGIQGIKDSGIKLTRTQESWVCALQSLRPAELIPEGLFLNGPIWPQDNIGPELLWMNKPLNERAAKLISEPISNDKN